MPTVLVAAIFSDSYGRTISGEVLGLEENKVIFLGSKIKKSSRSRFRYFQ